MCSIFDLFVVFTQFDLGEPVCVNSPRGPLLMIRTDYSLKEDALAFDRPSLSEEQLVILKKNGVVVMFCSPPNGESVTFFQMAYNKAKNSYSAILATHYTS